MKNERSAGIDEIPAELIKATGEPRVAILHKLCNRIWKTKQWPLDWKRSVFITLPKKGDTRECKNNRTISLISHASKVLLYIIANRMDRMDQHTWTATSRTAKQVSGRVVVLATK